MDLYEGILTRRSIRRWKPKEIEEGIITEILTAAMYAPSAHNARDWEFVVVTDPALKEKLSVVQPYVKIIKDAPAIIVVCGNLEAEKHAGFWVQDCSAAMQNLLLAAHARGLGATWCGIHPIADAEMAVQDILTLPSHVIPLGMCAMGYPDRDTARHPNRFEPAKIHYNKF